MSKKINNVENEEVMVVMEEQDVEPETKKGFFRKMIDGAKKHKGVLIAIGAAALGAIGCAVVSKGMSKKVSDEDPVYDDYVINEEIDVETTEIEAE